MILEMGSGCSRLGPTGVQSHTWGVLDTLGSLEIRNWLLGLWEMDFLPHLQR